MVGVCDPHAFISSPVKTEGSKMNKHEVSRLTVTEECGQESFLYETTRLLSDQRGKEQEASDLLMRLTSSVFMSVK